MDSVLNTLETPSLSDVSGKYNWPSDPKKHIEVQLISNTFELGAGKRGSSLGFLAIQIAAWEKKKDFFRKNKPTAISADNEPQVAETHPEAKYIEKICDHFDNIDRVMKQTLRENKVPIIISGDHISAAATIQSLYKYYSHNIGIVWIDAHTDIHSPYTSPSGNLHGMPLGINLGITYFNHQRNYVSQSVAQHWNNLINRTEYRVSPEKILYMGVRDIDEEELDAITQLGIQQIGVDEYRNTSSKSFKDFLQKKFQDVDAIYISYDVDALDPLHSSDGTGTPALGGFTLEEIKEILFCCIACKPIAAFELAEVNPCLDTKGNKTAEDALEVLEFMVSLMKN